MTVNIASNVFGVGATGAGRITPALVSVMNTSPAFIRLFDVASNPNQPIQIVIGAPGGGTFYNGTTVTIDPKDFITFSADPKLLVARIGHELAHAADSVKARGIAGADGITKGPTDPSILGPADYNLGRAKDEGFALYQEFLIAKDLGLSNFSADPGVPGAGIPGLFARMDASYSAMTTAGLSEAVKAQAMTTLAGTEGRDDRSSANTGLSAGLTYSEGDNKFFIVTNMRFRDASGNIIPPDQYPTANIVGFWQDDSGAFRISAINPTTGQVVTQDYVLSSDGKTKVLVSTMTDTIVDDGSGRRHIDYTDGRASVDQNIDSTGAVTPIVPNSFWRTIKGLFSDAVDTNGDGLPDQIVSAAPNAMGTNTITISPVGSDASGANYVLTPQIFDDGTSVVTLRYPTGQQSVTTTATDHSTRTVETPNPANPTVSTTTERNATGTVTSTVTTTPALDENNNPVVNTFDIITRDGSGGLVSSTTRTVNPIDGGYVDITITPAASSAPAGTPPAVTVTSTDPTGHTTPVSNAAAFSGLNTAVSGVLALNTFLNAVRGPGHGNGLPILSGLVNVANTFSGGQVPVLSTLNNGLGIANSLYGLYQAFRPGGSTTTGLVSGVNLLSGAANTYAISQGYTATTSASGAVTSPLQNAIVDPIEENIFGAAGGAVDTVNTVVPYLGIANALAHGQYGSAIGQGWAIYLAQSGSTVGPWGTVIGFFVGFVLDGLLAGDPPTPWGSANAFFDPATGKIKIASTGGAGGDQVAYSALSHLVGAVGYLAGQHNAANPATPLGLVTQRLGSLTYGIDRSNLTHSNGAVNGLSYSVTAIDPATGRDAGLRWDEASFRALDAPVGSAAYFQNLDEYYVANALARQAIAPVWEVQTGNLQAARGLSNAGHSANQFDTTYLIAAPAIFYWAGGVKIIEKEAANDDFSIVAA